MESLSLNSDLNAQAELAEVRELADRLQQQINQYDHELALAARVQQDFLPRKLPEIDGVRFATFYKPAGAVSGDMYDVFRLDEDHLAVYVVDAVGHGVAAALLGMFVKRAIVTKRIHDRSYALVPPDEALCLLNDEIVNHDLPDCLFASACYAVLNARTRRLNVATGGHPPPILLRPDGRIEYIVAEGTLLGVMASQNYKSAESKLELGDQVLIFSDGLEDMIVDLDKVGGLEKRLIAARGLPVDELVESLGRFVSRPDIQSQAVRDDVTIVGIQIG